MRSPRVAFDATALAIDASPALRGYAVVLSLLHALVAVSWVTYKHVATLVTDDDCVCWPLFPGCADVRAHLSPTGVRALLFAYATAGVVAALLFARRRARAALVAFVVACVTGLAIYALDYRLRTNQAYMFGAVAIALLVMPKKAHALQLLVALFYVWAGLLKTNAEWMTGAALYRKPWLVPESLVPAACAYVLFLELFVVWGLFSSRAVVRWIAYAQLLLFHALSWGVVGYFYPLLMFGLTSLYPLVWRRAPEDTLTFATLRSDAGVRRAVLPMAIAFSALQLVPRLFPGDTAITGEGRLVALHMFDARVTCEGGALVRDRSGRPIARAALINENLEPRVQCDPIVLLAEAQRLCRLHEATGDGARIDVAIDAKRSTDANMRPLVHVTDLCGRGLAYSMWHHNEWIAATSPL